MSIGFVESFYVIPKDVGRFPITVAKTGNELASVSVNFNAKSVRTFKGGSHAVNDRLYGDFFAENSTLTWNASEEGEKVILVEVFSSTDKIQSFFEVELTSDDNQAIERNICRCHIVSNISSFFQSNVVAPPVGDKFNNLFVDIRSQRIIPVVLDENFDSTGLFLDMTSTVNLLQMDFINDKLLYLSGDCDMVINCPDDNVKELMELDNYVIGIKMPFVSMSKTNTVVNMLSDLGLRGHIRPNSDILVLESDEQYFGANNDDNTVPLKMSFNAIGKYSE